MTRPDLVVVAPDHVDYPLWRSFLRENRSSFGNVIVSFSPSNRNYSLVHFVRQAMQHDDIIFTSSAGLTGDWRDAAIRAALACVSSDHILFMEQDFLVWNTRLLASILATDLPAIGFCEGSRWHPGFMCLKKDLLALTCMDFGAGDGFDHFGKITRDLLQRISFVSLEQLGFSSPKDWEHLAGLTNNYDRLLMGSVDTISSPARFALYNQQALALKIEQSPFFLQILQQAGRLR